jgi:hypothetical protein
MTASSDSNKRGDSQEIPNEDVSRGVEKVISEQGEYKAREDR